MSESDGSIDVLRIWKAISNENGHQAVGGCTGFTHLALRVLSMVPNSASTESAFSVFGNTYTKFRNWIGSMKVHKSTLIKMDIHCLHEASIPARKKRKFGSISADHASTATHDSSIIPLPIQDVPTSAGVYTAQDDDSTASFVNIAADLINHSMAMDHNNDDEVTEPYMDPPPSSTSTSYGAIRLCNLFDYNSTTAARASGLKFHWHIGKNLFDLEEGILGGDTSLDT
ncbi:hypothetical protein P691DRAFT_789271 [Macrolepiota fuliginosa MF-IS2]|uniref:HAT C-terminal dimerisation domain-containing protein n=1 Tax=Macrolepiota fuliginosa MF-IS2 TaxID=1400762 RepID=A0A9P5XFB3_9AGAR|nr:hypothetical protein P691DRAFT_789271 [Macrolepiota fuliginosa MF-IS2]